jgi:DNA-binding beta-propeller fold protein YncE
MKIYRQFVLILLVFTSFLLKECSVIPERSDVIAETIIYPPPPAEPRIQYLTSFSTSAEFTGPQSTFHKFIFGEEPPLPIVKPYGITIHGSKLYICDTGLGGLEVLDLEENTFEYFIPGGMGQLQFPLNCALDSRNYLYIADGNRKQVVIFNDRLNYVNAISLENGAKPTDVAVNDSLLFIAALDDHSIHVYDKTSLNGLMKISGIGESDSMFLYQPANIVLKDSLLMVSDLGGCKINTFSIDGSPLQSFGKPGREMGDFTRPKGIAADKDGNLYVVDAAFENIQLFNSRGELLMNFGGTYAGPGGMWLPAGVAVDYTNLDHFKEYGNERFSFEYLIYVSNQYGPDRISVYGFISRIQ